MSGGEAAKFLRDVEAFMRRFKVSATRFGAMAAGDTKFVKTLREGRQCRKATIEQVRAWMQTQGGL